MTILRRVHPKLDRIHDRNRWISRSQEVAELLDGLEFLFVRPDLDPTQAITIPGILCLRQEADAKMEVWDEISTDSVLGILTPF